MREHIEQVTASTVRYTTLAPDGSKGSGRLISIGWPALPGAVSPDGVGSLCPLIEVNRPLLLQCGNACF
jgi:hypothetical protein